MKYETFELKEDFLFRNFEFMPEIFNSYFSLYEMTQTPQFKTNKTTMENSLS